MKIAVSKDAEINMSVKNILLVVSLDQHVGGASPTANYKYKDE